MIIITILKFCHDRYKTQEICDKVVYGFLLVLKFVPDWFLQIKRLKNFTHLYLQTMVYFFDRDIGNVIFCCDEMGVLSVNVIKINLDDTNYDEDDPDTTILARLLTGDIKFEKSKPLKKELNEKLMYVVWHPEAFQKMGKIK